MNNFIYYIILFPLLWVFCERKNGFVD